MEMRVSDEVCMELIVPSVPVFPNMNLETPFSPPSLSHCSVGHTKHSWSNRALIFHFNISLFMCFPGGSDSKESACNEGDLSLIHELGRSPGGGHGNPLQYSCLENPMARGAWRATVQGITKIRTRLKHAPTHRKAECQRIDAFKLWFWRRFSRVPWRLGEQTSQS